MTASEAIKTQARTLGFTHVGIAEAVALQPEAERLDAWLRLGYHAGMAWMQRDPQRRTDPRMVLEGARSVIGVAMNYYSPEQHSADPDKARISRYAWGDDYHDLLTARLGRLEEFIVERYPGAATRRYVDTGPVMDKAWAVRSGIGWLGKNGNVITRDYGSWVFLGEILTTMELQYDTPMEDFCGSCVRCLDACPTQAIVQPYVVDSNKCISYLGIEHRGEHDEHVATMDFDDWIFGCDTCQDVCPWNSFAQPTVEEAFAPRPWNVAPAIEELATLSDEEFRTRFRKSPVKRSKPEGLRRNARTLLKQKESNKE
jgi:epoxyqueuosine reductase